MIRLAASLSLTQLLVVARRRTLYLLSGLATILSLAAFATVLLLADITSHREQPVMFFVMDQSRIFSLNSPLSNCVS